MTLVQQLIYVHSPTPAAELVSIRMRDMMGRKSRAWVESPLQHHGFVSVGGLYCSQQERDIPVAITASLNIGLPILGTSPILANDDKAR